jgi:anti-sigma B factor antagonist
MRCYNEERLNPTDEAMTMTDLTIQVRSHDQVSVVEPIGYLNAYTAKNFEEVLQALIDKNQLKIVINCHGLSYIASAGLGVIMGCIDTIRDNNGDIRMCSVNETVFNIFDVLGFTHLYSIFESEEKAINSFRETAS